MDLIEGHLLVGTIRAQAPRRLGRQLQQRPDGPTGLIPRAQFQNLPQQHENRHHRRRLEIDWDPTPMLAQVRREQPGGKSGNHAVHKGCTDAQRNQREHIGRSIDHRSPRALKERPGAPQNDGHRNDELHPARRRDGDDALPIRQS